METYREYTETKELSSEQKRKYWDMAFGLQAVDYLTPSEYMMFLANQHIEGQVSLDEIEDLLYRHYENETEEQRLSRSKEADIVSARINQILTEGGFTFSPVSLKGIHKLLFEDIYPDHAGQFRKVNLSKAEPILGGNSVRYANYNMIDELLAYDFEEEKNKKYSTMDKEKIVKSISKFTSALWQVHPFAEGNTRTTAVFIERYLNSLGFNINNDVFKEYSLFFRNALVRSNYADVPNDIDPTNEYLESFFENILFEGKNELRNRDMIIPCYVVEREEQAPQIRKTTRRK